MFKSLVTLAALLCAVSACHTIRSVPANQLTTGRTPQRVWVTRGDQSTVVVDLPEVFGDTLTGMMFGEPQSIPLSDAKVIRARRAAPGRTIALALLASAVTLGGVAYMQSRPDVGNARYCGNAIGSRPAPFTSCCPAQDTIPC